MNFSVTPSELVEILEKDDSETRNVMFWLKLRNHALSDLLNHPDVKRALEKLED